MPLAPLMLLAASACGAELRGGAHTACYESLAKAEGRPMGVVRVAWQVEASGSVTGVLVVATTLHSSAIESCIREDIARWQFPTAPRSTEIREYPFTF